MHALLFETKGISLDVRLRSKRMNESIFAVLVQGGVSRHASMKIDSHTLRLLRLERRIDWVASHQFYENSQENGVFHCK